jgi:hypothetical protein
METLAKNANERREVSRKLQTLRRLHRQSSLGTAGGGGSGCWPSSTKNTEDDTRLATSGTTLPYVTTPSCITASGSYYTSLGNFKELGIARRQSLVLDNNFFEGGPDVFELGDPFDSSFQPECANDLVRLFELSGWE